MPSEWRQDPLTERLVLISPERAKRPLRSGPSCPFCEGHEAETPPEVLVYRDPVSPANGPGWRVRVVPNRYAAVRFGSGEPPVLASEPPALAGGGEPPIAGGSPGTPGVGVAEVFIECPHHETKFRHLSQEQMVEVIRAWRDRLAFWREDGRIGYALVFKNEGRDAGASLDHCHSQLIGIGGVPEFVRREQGLSGNSLKTTLDCALCDDLASGRHRNDRFVAESPNFVSICPVAPRTPGELWICSRTHRTHFSRMIDDELSELADLLRDHLTRIASVFADPDFNLIVKSAPFAGSRPYHWRVEILPRTTRIAGWELGTGIFINTMFPEVAARLLREAR
jgi:UDPglucose--hexose-1-phosphate uridylyltransferase